jgi:hypothetical protein
MMLSPNDTEARTIAGSIVDIPAVPVRHRPFPVAIYYSESVFPVASAAGGKMFQVNRY